MGSNGREGANYSRLSERDGRYDWPCRAGLVRALNGCLNAMLAFV